MIQQENVTHSQGKGEKTINGVQPWNELDIHSSDKDSKAAIITQWGKGKYAWNKKIIIKE